MKDIGIFTLWITELTFETQNVLYLKAFQTYFHISQARKSLFHSNPPLTFVDTFQIFCCVVSYAQQKWGSKVLHSIGKRKENTQTSVKYHLQ